MHIAYFGGLFDGEGYVGVSYRDWDNAGSLRVTITNNYWGVLEMCRQRFGGSIISPSDGKSAWTWWLHSQESIDFLKAIQPCVVIKKPQVDLALQYPVGQTGKRVGKKAQQRRREIKTQLEALKHELANGQLPLCTFNRYALKDRDDVQQAIELYKSGMNTSEVAQQLGLHQPTVSYWMRSLGINRSRGEAQKRGGLKRVDSIYKNPLAQQAKEMYESGTPISTIARQLNSRYATVNAWLRKMGVTRSLAESQRLRREREKALTSD